MDKLWIVFEPLMFGLIGAEVKLEFMSTRLVGEYLGNKCIYLTTD